jgi:nicotinate phosphoribosyltransferase
MTTINGQPSPDGVFSLLDTDLYKLTMQCAVLKYFPDISVSYRFTNRTPHMQLTRAAFNWLQTQVENLGNIRVTNEEIAWLEKTCPYLSKEYLEFLKDKAQLRTILNPARYISQSLVSGSILSSTRFHCWL